MSIYTRASRYGLDEQLDNLVTAVERWRIDPHRTSQIEAAFDALADAVESCDSKGGHAHSEGIETGSKGGLR